MNCIHNKILKNKGNIDENLSNLFCRKDSLFPKRVPTLALTLYRLSDTVTPEIQDVIYVNILRNLYK
jgi:hypothetical protein